MRIFLPLLCVLCATPVHSILAGTCLRKEPPPGMLVLQPGSNLVVTCSGHVKVDGIKVHVARGGTNRKRSPSTATPTTVDMIRNTGVRVKSEKETNEEAESEEQRSNSTYAAENRSLAHAGTGHTASPTVVQPTSVSRRLKHESSWEAEDPDGKGDYEDEEEEEGEEGNRVTRGIKLGPRWKWNNRMAGKGEWGGLLLERRGATLSLSSVRARDSGKYTCYHRGRERFSLKVNVADPPESPSLSCYKKSPSSKIRCEWSPQKSVTISPNCSLLLSKRVFISPMQTFTRFQCSYSSRLSRCWCALDHNEDEQRTLHTAYLCVTSIAGNATSTPLNFIPLEILKPDPPSNVMAQQEMGQDKKIVVTWSFPTSWKSQDSYYKLTYELKYKPLMFSSLVQIIAIDSQRHTITDAIPGVEYQIQLRTKEEYDGQWSDWSTSVNASSWTAPESVVLLNEDPSTITFTIYTEGSGTYDNDATVCEPVKISVEVSHHILWIFGLFALLSVILAVYIFRHKDKFMSKIQNLSVVTHCSDSPQPSPPPSATAAPEVQSLVTFAPVRYKETPPSEVEEGEEENEEEQQAMERIEGMDFDNTSYFLLQRY